jgi:hypothetical protein
MTDFVGRCSGTFQHLLVRIETQIKGASVTVTGLWDDIQATQLHAVLSTTHRA